MNTPGPASVRAAPQLATSPTAAAALSPTLLSETDPAAAALARLARSRAHLRAALIPAPEPADGGAGGDGPGRMLKYLWRRVRRAGRATPAVDLALGALQAWWLTRPWLPAAQGVGHGVEKAVLPLVRRYPWAAVGVAASAGAAVVLLRPWRWSVVRGTWPLWRAGLLAQAMHQASRWPLKSVLSVLMGALGVLQTPTAPAPEAAPRTEDTA